MQSPETNGHCSLHLCKIDVQRIRCGIVSGCSYRALFWQYRKSKTSDFFGQKYGGFASKVRRFYAKKSDVSVLPKCTYTLHKKSFVIISYISYTQDGKP